MEYTLRTKKIAFGEETNRFEKALDEFGLKVKSVMTGDVPETLFYIVETKEKDEELTGEELQQLYLELEVYSVSS